MRLGGPVFSKSPDPHDHLRAAKQAGYGAIYCPIGPEADDATARAWETAAREAGIVIAEVGAWSNPLSPDESARSAALEKCRQSLALADRIGARCCVNIAGSRGPKWDGPHPDDLTPDTFDRIVQMVRSILDAVKPTRACYTLETMPWMYPDSPDSYLDLMRAIDRPRFAVHLDPVNLVNSPARYFRNGELIRECFTKLGPHIKSCHAKDIALRDHLTVHLDEVRPGLGGLDYGVFLREVSKLDPDTPVMLEHLPDEKEYTAAAGWVRQKAAAEGVALA